MAVTKNVGKNHPERLDCERAHSGQKVGLEQTLAQVIVLCFNVFKCMFFFCLLKTLSALQNYPGHRDIFLTNRTVSLLILFIWQEKLVYLVDFGS